MPVVLSRSMARPLHLDNERFGRLLVLSRASQNGAARWNCKCDCGTLRIINQGSLRNGDVKSCGCLRRERGGHSFGTQSHGLYKTPEYAAWHSMKSRCTNPNVKSYPSYGGRGIKVYPRWANSFETFFEDMGRRPSSKHSLDRIHNDGNYEPKNCRWATRVEQQRNTRCSIYFTIKGVTLSINEWSEATGLSINCMTKRKHRGWSDEKCVS